MTSFHDFPQVGKASFKKNIDIIKRIMLFKQPLRNEFLAKPISGIWQTKTVGRDYVEKK